MSDTLIKVEGLYKKFCRTLRRSMYYGALDVTRSMFGMSYDTGKLRKSEFWALQDINFELKRGETLGVIGMNGSGKTTLLRMLTGIFPPDKGKIEMHGRVGSLIAVGAGFHPHMSGRENIYLNGTILGMTRKEIKQKFDAIIDFAEIGDFLDSPVSTYSSGMRVRLGFAIAIHCEPDILLIDEILAVGDVGFQLKCFNYLGVLRNSGVSTLFVSHNMHLIATFCTNAILMNHGSLTYNGDVATAISEYKQMFSDIFISEGEIEKIITGTDEFVVKYIEFQPPINKNKIELLNSTNLTYIIHFLTLKDFNNVEIDTVIDLKFPVPRYFQANNHAFNKQINIKKGEGNIIVQINDMRLNNLGAYLSFAVWNNNKSEKLVWWNNVPIYVKGDSLSSGWAHYNIDYLVKYEKNV